MTGTQIYVDESKERGYLLVASLHADDEIADLRKLLRGLVLKGQRRIHMKKESDSRKRAIAAAICGAGVQATIYDAGRRYSHELDARAACLESLISDTPATATTVTIEQDDSLRVWDDRRLYELVRIADRVELRYEHRRASAEPLLAVPDAIAWCWSKGGVWRSRIMTAVTDVREV